MKYSKLIIEYLANSSKRNTMALFLAMKLTNITFKSDNSNTLIETSGDPLTKDDYKTFINKAKTMVRLSNEKPAYHL